MVLTDDDVKKMVDIIGVEKTFELITLHKWTNPEDNFTIKMNTGMLLVIIGIFTLIGFLLGRVF